MSPEDEVRNLIMRYAYLTDHMLHHLVADEIFAPDGVLEIAGTRTAGREALHRHYVEGRESIAAVVHQYTNQTVAVDGAAAESVVYATTWMWLPNKENPGVRPADMAVIGTYRDQLRHSDDGWRIALRTHHPLGMGGLATGTPRGEFDNMFQGFVAAGPADPTEWFAR